MLITPLREWLQGLRRERSRTISTLMGVGWGTFGVVAMLAFAGGMETLLHERAQGMGRAVVVGWIDQTTLPFRGFPKGRRLLASEADVVALATEVPGMGPISPEFSRSEQVAAGERIFRTNLSGVLPSYGVMRAMTPMPGGRFLNGQDQTLGRRVMFMGNAIKHNLFGDQDVVGRELVLAGAPFTIIGVLQPKEQSSDYGGMDEDRICIPSSTYQRLFGDRWVDNFVFQAKDTRGTAGVIDGVYRVLGRRLRFDPKDRDALNIWDTTDGDRMLSTIFGSVAWITGLAGGLTLLVGGLGVGNLMFLLVKRRTPEIGVQMALGALPRWILMDVMVQTFLLVGAGGLLGLLAAWTLAKVVALTPLVNVIGVPQVSHLQAALIAATLMAVGLAAGYFPARRAARLDPVRALAD